MSTGIPKLRIAVLAEDERSLGERGAANTPRALDPQAVGTEVSGSHLAQPETLDVSFAFRRYASYVAAIGVRVLGRRDELDDFVQDVFLSAHRSIGALRDPAALKGWLATLAVREAIRRLKRRRVYELLGRRSTPDYEDVADASASAEERALLAAVFRALDRLPTDERVAWSLRYLEGETMERVAELARCSLSTAKRRVASAEQALEKMGVGRG